MAQIPADVLNLIKADDATGLNAALNSNESLKALFPQMLKKAAVDGRTKCVEALVTAGAEPNLDAAWNAAYCEHWPATLYLLQHGVSIEELHKKTGDLVQFFVDRGMLDGVKYAIEHLTAPKPDQQAAYFRSCCVSDRCLDILKFMVEKWAIKPELFETEERFSKNLLPQHIAAGCYAPKTLQYLLDLGANVNAVSMDMTPAFLNSCGYKPLPGSVGTQDDVLQVLENNDKFDINFQIPSSGDTVLHKQWFLSTLIKRRLSLGADPYIKNNEGKTVLDIVNEQTKNLFEDALRVWKMFSLGKLKYTKKGGKRGREGEGAEDESDAKRVKLNPEEVPLFHTIEKASSHESGMWCHSLGDDEEDDDKCEFRTDKGKRPLTSAILEDLASMDSDEAKLARQIASELDGVVFGTETDSKWMPFVITIPGKSKKATFLKLVQSAMRAPKAKLSTTKFTTKTKSFFLEDDETGKSYKATEMMRANLTGVLKMEFPDENICFPVLVVGKAKSGNALVGVFALGVYT